MGGLREKYQNNVLHGNMNMAPLNEWLLYVFSKFQNVNMYEYVSDLCAQIYVTTTLNN